MKYTLLVISLFTSLSCSVKSDFENYCSDLDAADLEMLTVHNEIKKQYADDERFLKRLQDAQVYWIQYTNRHIRSLYPKEKRYYEETYGKTYNQCKCKELTKLTKLRAKELSMWLDGNKGDECPTSIK